MKIKDHMLTATAVQLKQSPNRGKVFANGVADTIVIHYTAGSSAESSVRTLCDPNSKASAHLVVGRDGSVTQLVPFNVVAWHAGASRYGNRVGFNQFSIGIEIDNAGVLEKRGDKFYSWFNRGYQADEVVEAVHRNQSAPRYWHSFTEEQIAVVYDICQLLISTYQIQYILGHEEISPGRKIDPGPAFPLDKLRDRLLGSGRDADTTEDLDDIPGVVTADLLNIRSEPSAESEKIANPLAKGHKVKIMATKNGWMKVRTEITGWVSSMHIG